MVDLAIGGRARLYLEFLQQRVKPHALANVPDTNAERAVFVMQTHRDHRTVKARVEHAGHCQQQPA